MVWMLTAAAWAGYGDAGVDFPTAKGRQMALWVNAARVQPDAFETEYNAGGCSFAQFSVAEQTPQEPYRWHDGLSEVALLHSIDMATSGLFQHDSSDGTLWYDRIGPYYPGGWLGENISLGYSQAKRSVLRNWMCSTAGHRAAIMSSLYEDFGGDMDGSYATADFGAGAGGPFPSIRIGAHEPLVPSGSVDLLADWVDTAAPDTFEAVLDGQRAPLALLYGAADSGVYGATVPIDASACHEYFFVATLGGVETRFPETGSYSFGTCAGAGLETGWMPVQVEPTYTQSSATWTAGGVVTLTVTGAVPGTTVTFLRGSSQGAGICPTQTGGECIDVTGSIGILGVDVVDATGTATLPFAVPSTAPPGIRPRHQAAVPDGLGNFVMTEVLTGTVQ